MIKIDGGNTNIKGTGVELLSELSLTAHVLKEKLVEGGISADKVDKAIKDAIETGLKSFDELKEEVDKAEKELFDDFIEFMRSKGKL